MITNFNPKRAYNLLLEKISRGLAKTRTPEQDILGNLPESGRSSEEILPGGLGSRLSSYANYFSAISPDIPPDIQKYITLVTITNPDLSQAVKNTVNLGNTGHSLIVDAKNSEAVIDHLNELSYQIYKRSAGVDGLINHYFAQLCRTGALSSEDIIPDLSGVSKVVIVPVYSIRFKYEENEYRPYQQTNTVGSLAGLGLIPLNENTFRFFTLESNENSPYPIPPYLPALKPLLIQDSFLENIGAMAKKLGLLGLNHLLLKRLPRRSGENETQYKERSQKYLAEVAESMEQCYHKGILVSYDDQTLDHHSITNNASGVKDIFGLVEEQIFSGVGSHPAMHGRPNSTTESYARVIYNMTLNAIRNQRRLVKRRQESTYRLDLMLRGIPFNFLSLQFKNDQRLQPNVEMMADRIYQNMIMEQVKTGLLTPDEAAQKLGYSSWADEKRLWESLSQQKINTQEFMFNRELQRYELVRPVLANLKTDDKDAKKDQQRLEQFAEKYLQSVFPFYYKLQQDAVTWAVDYIKENYRAIQTNPGKFLQTLVSYLSQHPDYISIPNNEEFKKAIFERVVDASKFYRSDLTVFGDNPPKIIFKFGAGDQQAADLYRQIDIFYFSKFISNQDFGGDINEFLTHFLERGEALYGGWTEAAQKEFLSLFGPCLEGNILAQMKRIVNSSIGMIQVNNRFKQLFEAGFEFATWIENDNCCEICRPWAGVDIPVAKVWKKIDQSFLNAGSLEGSLDYIKSCNRTLDDAGKSVEEILSAGGSWGKLHPHCHGSLRGKFND